MAASLSPRPIQPANPQHQAQQPSAISSSLTCLPFNSQRSPSAPIKHGGLTLMERRGRITLKLQVRAAGAGTLPSCPTHPAAATTITTTTYDVLEISPTASDGEIKTAYRRLARQHHPDRAPLHEKEARTDKFLQIHSAYSVLSDPSRRAQYDLQLSLAAFQSTGYKGRYPRTPRAYYSASAPSSTYCSPRSPFSSGRGRSWETDQCWC